ncbi:hypothetical protein [Salisediminibacterium halotolerans]|uniref:hypothetical protein n=1 Tax=Salisediminibacterium halotolerans TaxID=517425 RepID=UPI000EB14BEF|nr:hypothetical protein [Salisediminibacterium halotolerans]RLJ69398.1 hypothetical protein BCL39_2671 [Actinophytocola xinjiangensis]RPE83976.1 hypothetical protein EDD67_2537 [Salisediminibacterium halotolerans]TWG32473.1 hypothetical protein BCL52_2666 [Salisediminibacterium halotolerans]GEL08050.1 hypothetical protein SHA02_14660 [Salisediminibacterium halotolerans]
MQQEPLENIVQTVSPAWLHLLKSDERHQDVVLRNGMNCLNESDVAEIVEAVIQQRAKNTLYQ